MTTKIKPIAIYPDTVEYITTRKPQVKENWFQDYRMRKHNDFYEAHPEIWVDPVSIKIPTTKNFKQIYKAQAGETFLTAMPEISSMADLIRKENPKRILDIGCGFGRSSVYLFKRFNWSGKFNLVDAELVGEVKDVLKKDFTTQFKNQSTDYYSNFGCIADYCNVNGLKNYQIHDAVTWEPTVQYDFVISTLAFGYHWDLNIYLDRIYNNVKKGSFIIFGTRGFDQRQDGGKYTNEQLAKVDYTKVKLIRDVRVRENLKASMLIFKKL